ncbi:tetrapyrrole-binding protein, chloroplastic [Cannabis sativa]|uniref:tetrapyrrole-binding protein, chloroplastic n=1 Tax=Cannabis sativa TaxID=3483 RepID=UPI0029CA488B|nr:tetrapyrrole-binding protein, chloroplastic [Cannabis sativa]
MATNTALHYSIPPNNHSLLKHTPPPHPPSSLTFLKPTTTTNTTTTAPPSLSLSSTSSSSSSSSTITFSLSPNTTASTTTTTATSTSSPSSSSFDDLQRYLAAADFRQADEETRRLLIVLAGEAAQKRGYVFFSEVQFISKSDMKTIDELWRSHSNERFGYSVQRKIFKKVNRDFTRFFIKLGWMKKLDTEVVQYNYRAFPDEFIWELKDDTPEGHLPLTNALRGTQLLNSILTHPAFVEDDDEESEGEEEEESGGRVGGLLNGIGKSKPSSATSSAGFKPDYSF